MNLSLQDFSTMVKTQVEAVNASCRQLIDTSIGSVLRAIVEANASVGLWIQWLILQVLATTRAATSSGTDLDTWVADFGMLRLPATAAAGLLTFTRLTPGLAATIPVGALARTGTGTADQIFIVTADTTVSSWVGGGYQMAAADVQITVPSVASTTGSAGNVRPATVTQLASSIPGVDAVTNNVAMAGGLDAETDDALRLRFSSFLDSRTRATEGAIGFAIASVRQGLSYTIAERTDASGAIRPGHFTVTLDDGSGAPPGDLVVKVSSAIDAVRPVGGTFSVQPPHLLPVTVDVRAIGPAEGLARAQAALALFISSLPIGSALVISKIIQITHDADPEISKILSATINGAANDFVPGLYGLVRPAAVTVSP